MMQLQRKVKVEKFFGGANHKQTEEERELGVSNEELTYGKRETIVVKDVPQDFVEELKAEQKKPAAETTSQPNDQTTKPQEDAQ